MSRSFQELGVYVSLLNEKWRHDPVTKEPIVRPIVQHQLLIVSEIMEAFEGLRKNCPDTHLPHRKMVEVELADTVIRLLDFASEKTDYKKLNQDFSYHTEDMFRYVYEVSKTSDLEIDLKFIKELIRLVLELHEGSCIVALLLVAAIEKYCVVKKYDLWGAFGEKFQYNIKRQDHKHENRAKDGGKKF